LAEPSSVQVTLEANFPFLAGKVASPRVRRIFVEVPTESFPVVLDFVCRELGFNRLCTITGMDDRGTFVALYSLSRPDGTVLNVKQRVPGDKPVITSITDRFPGGANYERELVDLLGFEVLNLPSGRRYPLPDDWPVDQKPLRKDWKAPTPTTAS
jgi:membrane-bound hydrogenase subunit beta